MENASLGSIGCTKTVRELGQLDTTYTGSSSNDDHENLYDTVLSTSERVYDNNRNVKQESPEIRIDLSMSSTDGSHNVFKDNPVVVVSVIPPTPGHDVTQSIDDQGYFISSVNKDTDISSVENSLVNLDNEIENRLDKHLELAVCGLRRTTRSDSGNGEHKTEAENDKTENDETENDETENDETDDDGQNVQEKTPCLQQTNVKDTEDLVQQSESTLTSDDLMEQAETIAICEESMNQCDSLEFSDDLTKQLGTNLITEDLIQQSDSNLNSNESLKQLESTSKVEESTLVPTFDYSSKLHKTTPIKETKSSTVPNKTRQKAKADNLFNKRTSTDLRTHLLRKSLNTKMCKRENNSPDRARYINYRCSTSPGKQKQRNIMNFENNITSARKHSSAKTGDDINETYFNCKIESGNEVNEINSPSTGTTSEGDKPCFVSTLPLSNNSSFSSNGNKIETESTKFISKFESPYTKRELRRALPRKSSFNCHEKSMKDAGLVPDDPKARKKAERLKARLERIAREFNPVPIRYPVVAATSAPPTNTFFQIHNMIASQNTDEDDISSNTKSLESWKSVVPNGAQKQNTAMAAIAKISRRPLSGYVECAPLNGYLSYVKDNKQEYTHYLKSKGTPRQDGSVLRLIKFGKIFEFCHQGETPRSLNENEEVVMAAKGLRPRSSDPSKFSRVRDKTPNLLINDSSLALRQSRPQSDDRRQQDKNTTNKDEEAKSELEKRKAKAEEWSKSVSTSILGRAKIQSLKELGCDDGEVSQWWDTLSDCRYLRHSNQ